MPKSSPLQSAFNGGKWGRRVQGRADLQKYQYACNVLDNFIPTVQGPAVKRSGTRYLKAVKDESAKSRLIPFEFSTEQAYVLELSEGVLRVMRNSSAVLDASPAALITDVTASNPVVIETDAAHGLSNGDEIYIQGCQQIQLNQRFHIVANVTATTLELSGEDGTGRTASSALAGLIFTVYEIVDGGSISIPWLEADLDEISFVQSADVLYLAHPDYPPHKITRTSDTAWTCEEIEFDWPPMSPENVDDDVTMYASAATGTAVTVTAVGGTPFTANMVGGYISLGLNPEANYPEWGEGRSTASGVWGTTFTFPIGGHCYYEGTIYRLTSFNGAAVTGFDPPVHDTGTQEDNAWSWLFVNFGYGYAKITGFTSSTEITVNIDDFGVEFPSRVVGSALATKKWAISAFNEEYGYPRALTFFEDRLWFAGTNSDPQTFWGSAIGQYEDFQTIASDVTSGLLFTLASDKINAIEWMAGDQALMIGTRGGEFVARSGTEEEAITSDNITVRRQSNYGVAPGIQPRFVDSELMFVQRSKERLHRLIFSAETARYVAPDLTDLVQEILRPGAAVLEYQASPFRQLWALKSSGALANLVYVAEQDVYAWADVTIGGTDVVVESVAVIPHPDGDQDQVWLVVSRTINSVTRRYIEILQKPFDEDFAYEDAYFVDVGLTWDDFATSELQGLNHLAGETVNVFADGSVLGQEVVSSNGRVTIDSAASVIHIGLPFSARLQTMRLEAGAADGTAQGRRKRIHQLVMRVDLTGESVEYGPDFDNMDTWELTAGQTTDGDSPSYTMPGGYERAGRIAIRHSEPAPCTIVALMPQMTTESR